MIRVDLAALNRELDEMGEGYLAAARPAAQAAAQVLYDEVQRNVSAIPRVTGNLANAIYQAYATHHSHPGIAVYHVSWNARKAPHGGLIEFGHIMRYASYVGKDGKFYTVVRPNMRGKPKPKRSASQAVKDKYYLPLASPKQIAGHAFIRRAANKEQQATEAAIERLMREVG